MEIAFSEEHEQLRDVVRKFLTDHSDEEAVRALMATEKGYDETVWKQLAQELGLVGLIVPESYGGAGFTAVELVVAMEEMGRALLCAPFLSTAVLATSAILESGDEAAMEALLPRIASGEALATLALTEESGSWDASATVMKATVAGSDFTLTGVKTNVLDGHVADIILVVARTDAGLGIFHVDGNAAGLTRTALPVLDQTRKLAKLEFVDTPAKLIGTEGGAEAPLARTLDLAAAAIAAEQLGGAEKCLEMSVEYGKTRIQFGRPIGSFQAIKHKCADMLVETELAKSAAYNAGFTAAESPEDLGPAASMAKAYCSEAFMRAASENIQIHGGIGFTWEHPAHLYFKRAKSSEIMFGDPIYHRDRLADHLGI